MEDSEKILDILRPNAIRAGAFVPEAEVVLLSNVEAVVRLVLEGVPR